MDASIVKRQLQGLRTVVTHISPDIDAIMATFLLWNAAGRPKGLQFIFVPPGGGEDSRLEEGWAVVDTGKGLFDHHQKNAQNKSATAAVFSWLYPALSKEERSAASLLVSYANKQDHGRGREFYCADGKDAAVAEAMSITAIYQSIMYKQSDGPFEEASVHRQTRSLDTLKEMLSLLAGLYDRKLGHYKVRRELPEKEEWVSECGKVVLLHNGDRRHTRLEESRGRKLVVFYNDVGFTGVARTAAAVKCAGLGDFYKSSQFIELFEGIREEYGEWFVHYNGHIMSRAMKDRNGLERKRSKLEPRLLASAALSWLYVDNP